MAKTDLALKLADEFGVAVGKARRFVDDVGADTARGALDDAASQGDETARWLKPAAATAGLGGLAGGGALLWRQQDVQKARALAQQSKSYRDTVADVMDSDLPPKLKKQLLEGASQTAGGGGGGGDGGGGLLPDDPAALIVLVIVLVFVLKFALEGDE